MHRRWYLIGALASVLFATAPAQAADLSGEATLVSDYRYRGISLSDGKPALQGSLDLEPEAGPYAGLWASSIRDEGKTSAELALTAGDEVDLGGTFSLDLSATFYAYPE